MLKDALKLKDDNKVGRKARRTWKCTMKLKTKSKDYDNCIKQRKVKMKLNFYEQNIMLKIWQKNMTISLNKNTIIQESKQQ